LIEGHHVDGIARAKLAGQVRIEDLIPEHCHPAAVVQPGTPQGRKGAKTDHRPGGKVEGDNIGGCVHLGLNPDDERCRLSHTAPGHYQQCERDRHVAYGSPWIPHVFCPPCRSCCPSRGTFEQSREVGICTWARVPCDLPTHSCPSPPPAALMLPPPAPPG